MAKKNRIISIDFGKDSIKALQLEIQNEKIEITKAIIEPIGSNGDSLKKVWHSIGRSVTNLPIVVSLPRNFVTTRKIVGLPANVDDDQLPNLVAMQAEAELPFRSDESVYDFDHVERNGKSTSVELTVARRSDVNDLLENYKQIGIKPKFVLPSTNAIAVLAENQSQNRTIAIADIGASRTDFCVVSGLDLHFSRSFAVAGDQLTRSFQGDEDLKIRTATLNENEISPATQQWSEQFLIELKKSISAAQRNLDQPISEIWLCGGGSRIDGLTDFVSAQLSIPTRIWDAIRELPQNVILSAEIDDNFSDRFAIALGQGINALTNRVDLNLLPRADKEAISKSESQRRTLMGIAVSVLFVIGIGIGVASWSKIEDRKIVEIDEQIRQIRISEVKAKKLIGSELKIANLLTPRLSALDILRELSFRFSDRTKVALTGFSIARLDEPSKTKITFNVEANSHDEISNLVSVISQSNIFTAIKQGQITSVERNRKPIFQVQIACNIDANAIQNFAEKRYIQPITSPNESEDQSDQGPREENFDQPKDRKMENQNRGEISENRENRESRENSEPTEDHSEKDRELAEEKMKKMEEIMIEKTRETIEFHGKSGDFELKSDTVIHDSDGNVKERMIIIERAKPIDR